MKRKIFFCMITMLAVSAFSVPGLASKNLTTGELGLIGKVETLTEQQTVWGENDEYISLPLRTIRYDSNGRVSRVITYRGSEACRDQGYQYDSQGRVAIEGHYTEAGVLQKDIEHFYAGNGQLAKSLYFKEDGSVFLTKAYSYDSSGNMLAERQEAGGQIIVNKKYSFDRNTAETIMDIYGPEGKLLATEKERAGVDGTSDHTWYYDRDFIRYRIRKHTTTKEDQAVSSFCYLPSGIYENKICDSFEEGNIKRTISRADGTVLMELYFDDEGKMKLYNRFAADGSVENSKKYLYEYDEHGNWTDMTVYERTPGKQEWKAAERVRRMFTYYE